MRIRVLGCALILAALFCGCKTFLDYPYFEVKESGLNWVSIRHYNLNTKPMQRVTVRIDGNGMVQVREGTSALVSNPFAAGHEASTWNDIRESRIVLARDEVQPLFQMLVDRGLFLERRKNDCVSSNESIFVSANIQNKTCGSEDDVYTTDPELAENLKSVLMMFYHPQPKSRR